MARQKAAEEAAAKAAEEQQRLQKEQEQQEDSTVSLDADARRLLELKKKLMAIQTTPKKVEVIEIDGPTEQVSLQPPLSQASNKDSVNLMSASKNDHANEESSFLPAYVPQAPKEDKKLVKKVRFWEDGSLSASAEKPRKPTELVRGRILDNDGTNLGRKRPTPEPESDADEDYSEENAQIETNDKRRRVDSDEQQPVEAAPTTQLKISDVIKQFEQAKNDEK